ncbi:hypothetical protein GLW08_20300 [Pontibacillus yanchengensis]|uniref:Uncharacterized protein n=2 Tax=Pontibacillus yanchengensis TaxID=462910 RepID=A0ACC7VLG2_9BACI|nr:hypothetical protein [Pontibacillus yanchengensis]MYL35447.1 hypothetical protein [Pontibacillus yanchengensis]MYL55647.1 hypothetical protein [Pontibacillus yanchengensis]
MKFGIYNHYWRLSEFLEDRKSHNIVASRDGHLYEIRRTPFGMISVPASENALRRLEEVPKGFQFELPLIPGEIMEQILTFFRKYCNPWVESEVMIQIFWHKTEHYYKAICPPQKVSKVHVDAEPMTGDGELVEVLQIHSHNTMDAYFSSTDNADEQRFLLYGVVGRLNETNPSILLRVGLNGYFYTLPIERVFTNFNKSKDNAYPIEWDNNIEYITFLGDEESLY